MKAGFARERITPPPGTRLLGFGQRDMQQGSEGVHDELYASALFLDHGGEQALIMGFDLCFFGRAEADRYRGALGRKLGLAPRQILLNASHTHNGPATATWGYIGYAQADTLYLDELETRLVRAALAARAAGREAALWAGAARTRLPVSRRKPDGKGGVTWRPYPEGTVCESLPLCLFKDDSGRPICLLYSVSCHPSTTSGWEVTADYPGIASRLLAAHLGLAADAGGCLFLQGCGGDTKAATIANGHDGSDAAWRRGTWADIEAAGRMVAEAAIPAFEHSLRRIEPGLRAHELEMLWPLEKPPSREDLGRIAADAAQDELRRLWARRQITLLDRGSRLPEAASITLHGIWLGAGLRLIGLEGEAVGELGLLIENFYSAGVTFPLGYTDGAQLYLPAERMLPERGYEVDSYYEYGFPAPLAPGFEKILVTALRELRTRGIE